MESARFACGLRAQQHGKAAPELAKSLQEGMGALKAAMDIGGWFAGAQAPLAVIAPAAIAGEVVTMDEWQAKAELVRFGLRTPAGRLAEVDSLAAAADAIGYPVVLKAVVPGLAHKTEAGAVAVGIRDAGELQHAATGMGSLGSRFLVEAMVPAAVVELLVGVTRDPQFGLSLTVAAGGSLVELLADARTLLFPVTEGAVSEALDALKAATLLAGYRNGPRGDRRAVVDAVMAIAAYAEAHAERLEELSE